MGDDGEAVASGSCVMWARHVNFFLCRAGLPSTPINIEPRGIKEEDIALKSSHGGDMQDASVGGRGDGSGHSGDF